MSFNRYDAPFTLNIRPALLKWLIVLVPHLLVLVLILFVDEFNLTLKVVLIFCLLLSVIYYFCLHISQSLAKSVILVQQDQSRNWFISTRGGHQLFTVELLPSSFVSRYLIILNFKNTKSRLFFPTYSVLLTKDSLTADGYRMMKVRLKTLNPA